jgi:hypothetical protein
MFARWLPERSMSSDLETDARQGLFRFLTH